MYANAKPCPVCQLTKMRKVPRPLSGPARHSNLRMFMDVWGPFKVPSVEYGYHYLIGFTYEGSGYMAVYPTKRQDTSVLIISTMKRYWGDMARFNLDVKILRTDGGPEMPSNEFQEYLSGEGVTWEHSAPYVHEQVGMQGRRWGMIIPRAMAMLKQCGATVGWGTGRLRHVTRRTC